MSAETKSVSPNFFRQLRNLFQPAAYVRLKEHGKLLGEEGDQSHNLKTEWQSAKKTFGPFLGLAQFFLATRLIRLK